MAVLRISIDDDGDLARLLTAFKGVAGGGRVKKPLAEGVITLWERHLSQRDRQPNKLGGARTHYWAEAARSLTGKSTAKGVVVSATQYGLRMKATGGDIFPENSGALTIPIHADAHGKRAREFPNLFIVNAKDEGGDTTGFLAREKGEDGFEVLYLLRKKVTIKQDDEIFPAMDQVEGAALDAVLSFLSKEGYQVN